MSRHTVVTIKFATLRCTRFNTYRLYTYDFTRGKGPWGGETREKVHRSGVVLPTFAREAEA